MNKTVADRIDQIRDMCALNWDFEDDLSAPIDALYKQLEALKVEIEATETPSAKQLVQEFREIIKDVPEDMWVWLDEVVLILDTLADGVAISDFMRLTYKTDSIESIHVKLPKRIDQEWF